MDDEEIAWHHCFMWINAQSHPFRHHTFSLSLRSSASAFLPCCQLWNFVSLHFLSARTHTILHLCLPICSWFPISIPATIDPINMFFVSICARRLNHTLLWWLWESWQRNNLFSTNEIIYKKPRSHVCARSGYAAALYLSLYHDNALQSNGISSRHNDFHIFNRVNHNADVFATSQTPFK